jgi:acyl dehydratase
MTPVNFPADREARAFEDFVKGAVHRFGPIAAEEGEMLNFAKRYDPQDFHTDPVAAMNTMFGGVIASGWLTGSLMMRLYALHYLPGRASLGSPGLDELRWPRPVRPGDQLTVQVSVQDARLSASKPDRGVVHSLIEVINQANDVVMSMKAVNLMLTREALNR